MITAILFDKDGTLTDYEKSWANVNRSAAFAAADGDRGLAQTLLTLGGINATTGRATADSLLAAASTREIARAWVDAGSPFSVMELEVRLDRLFQEAVMNAVPVTNLYNLFTFLKGHGLKIGIASSDSEASVQKTIARFEIDALVDFAVGYDSGFGSKPGGGMVEAFCLAIDSHPQHIAVVGDNLHDMAMAEAGGAGLKIGVLTGTGTRESLRGSCDICLESIAELESILVNSIRSGTEGILRENFLRNGKPFSTYEIG